MGAGDLVDADKHRLSGFPSGRAVIHEVRCDLVEALVGGYVSLLPPGGNPEQTDKRRNVPRVNLPIATALGDVVYTAQMGKREFLRRAVSSVFSIN
jgi:hypothetical protein